MQRVKCVLIWPFAAEARTQHQEALSVLPVKTVDLTQNPCRSGIVSGIAILGNRELGIFDQLLENITQLFATAITSISTRTSFGNRAT